MMTVRWSGPQTDLLACGNELSRSLLTGVTSGITYEGTRDDEFTNCLTLEFGEKT